eukprot:782460-Pelagomonas_calceolata.AAC.2
MAHAYTYTYARTHTNTYQKGEKGKEQAIDLLSPSPVASPIKFIRQSERRAKRCPCPPYTFCLLPPLSHWSFAHLLASHLAAGSSSKKFFLPLPDPLLAIYTFNAKGLATHNVAVSACPKHARAINCHPAN